MPEQKLLPDISALPDEDLKILRTVVKRLTFGMPCTHEAWVLRQHIDNEMGGRILPLGVNAAVWVTKGKGAWIPGFVRGMDPHGTGYYIDHDALTPNEFFLAAKVEYRTLGASYENDTARGKSETCPHKKS